MFIEICWVTFRWHDALFGKLRFSANIRNRGSPVAFAVLEVPRHGRSEEKAAFQFKLFVEANILRDRIFDMMGGNC